ncbi:MAG TPA: hypothetical protein VF587_08255 [Solirubrobacteraceae bacterium]
MWRWGLIILLLFTAGFYEQLDELVSFADVIGILVLIGVPGTLLIDAKIRRRRGAVQ